MKNKKFQITNWDEAKAALSLYAGLQNEIAKAKLLLDEAVMEAGIAFSRATERDAKDSDALEKALVKFAKAHPNDFSAAPDGDGRTFEHAGARLRVRKAKDKVEIADDLAAIEYLDRWRPELVRREVYPDKVALLAAFTEGDAAVKRALEEHGVRLEVGKDKFSVETV